MSFAAVIALLLFAVSAIMVIRITTLIIIRKLNSRIYTKKISFADMFFSLVKKEYLDVKMSKTMQEHLSRKSDFLSLERNSNITSVEFDTLITIYENLLQCCDIKNRSLLVNKQDASYIFDKFKIKCSKYAGFYLKDKEMIDNSFIIFVCPNTILLFLDSKKGKMKFLCALYPQALTCTFHTCIEKRNVIVQETSRESISYYEKFNPVPDSKIVWMGWEKTNQDGSRSFRGGLLPENNPLLLELEYGKVTLTIGRISTEYCFSNSGIVKKFATTYVSYHSKLTAISNVTLEQENLFDSVLKRIKKYDRLWKFYTSNIPKKILKWSGILLLVFALLYFIFR